ncbi:MAG TPA: GGDEF domain-containing phosphodiesterase, partial [Spirochaetia bacterium]|nr:GGDEF domain-containing phosphodiesterase [Spirochaetia bacterium]
YHYQGADIRIGCCVGIALYPDDGEESRKVIGRASAAMRSARRAKQEYQFHNPEIHSRASERLSLETDMQRAFDKDQFSLVYQPIVDADGRIQGAEALIRWKHPEKGIVPPAAFLPLAAESGFIHSISKWVLYSAADQVAQWFPRYGIYVSVNLSAEDFSSHGLEEVLESALRRSGVSTPGALKLEITESQCMIDPDGTVAQMNRLQTAGFDMFIDDFGTGNSSLGWLKRLPAGTIKIDHSFVDESMTSREDREFLTNIVALARSRRKRVILEGVGTPQQYDLLKDLVLDGLQGYYFARPVPPEALEALLAADARLPVPAPAD